MKKSKFPKNYFKKLPKSTRYALYFAAAVVVLGGIGFIANSKKLKPQEKSEFPRINLTSPSPVEQIPTNTVTSFQVSKAPTINTTINPTYVPTATPTSAPTTPALHPVTVSGFTYEDTNQDGQYNNGEPRLGNMSLRYFDSNSPSLVYGYYSNSDGSFSLTFSVKGSLGIIPSSNLNYLPVNGQQQYPSSAQNVMFGFRTSGAVQNGSGSIEGDVYLDSNKNGTKDSGENGISFYKLYLIDSHGNYYNTEDNAQATRSDGHFKYINLNPGTYTIQLSNPSYIIPQPQTSVTIPNGGNTSITNVEISVQH